MDEKATQLHAIASLRVLLDATKPQRGAATTSAANHVNINLRETKLADAEHEAHEVHDHGLNGIDTTLDSVSLAVWFFVVVGIFDGDEIATVGNVGTFCYH